MGINQKTLPGILLCAVLAIPCWLLGQQFHLVGSPIFAIILGIIIGSIFTSWKREKTGAGIGRGGAFQQGNRLARGNAGKDRQAPHDAHPAKAACPQPHRGGDDPARRPHRTLGPGLARIGPRPVSPTVPVN